MFERILQENERQLKEPTTEWAVEPVLDVRDFFSWLETLDVIRSVSFTAKLPNPEPRADFEDLVARMERRHATKFTETLQSDRDEGLLNVQEDPYVRQAAAMAGQGFATVRGRGQVGGTVTKYSQKETVATERVPDLPDSWDGMRVMLTDFLKHRLRRFIDRDEAA